MGIRSQIQDIFDFNKCMQLATNEHTIFTYLARTYLAHAVGIANNVIITQLATKQSKLHKCVCMHLPYIRIVRLLSKLQFNFMQLPLGLILK